MGLWAWPLPQFTPAASEGQALFPRCVPGRERRAGLVWAQGQDEVVGGPGYEGRSPQPPPAERRLIAEDADRSLQPLPLGTQTS